MSIDFASTAWVLIAAALVMLMTPAVGFFYGGMVNRKNIVSTLMQSFLILSIITLQWMLFGYSLAFGNDVGGIIGGTSFLGLNGVGLQPNPVYSDAIPEMAFMVFQSMFAVITVALIVGSFVGRIKLSALAIFAVLWSTLVYDFTAHWVWGSGGWLRNLGVLDFAGGTVVHINAGIAALVAAFIIRKRLDFNVGENSPNNLPLILLGAVLLWFGWFGFNAGSALSPNAIAVNAFVTTNIAAAAALLSWSALSWLKSGKVDLPGAATGAVIGLVAITPACGFVGPLAALIIGLVAPVFSYLAINFRITRGLDDTLDVWACHGVAGIWGALATGIFADAAINGADGLIFGNFAQFGVQALGVAITIAYSFAMTFIILKVIDRTIGLRVSEEDERIGLDVAQHSDEVYMG